MTQLPGPRGLVTNDVIDMLLNRCHYPNIQNLIPFGVKNDVYCVIDNSKNVSRNPLKINGLHGVLKLGVSHGISNQLLQLAA